MKKIITSLICCFSILTGIQPAQAVDTRTIDIVAITWNGAPTPTHTVNDVKLSIEKEVTARWNYLAQNWPSGINFRVGTVSPNPVVMSVPLICEGTESAVYMRDARRAFYTKNPMEDYASHYLILLSPVPRPNCVWEGKSLIGDAANPGGLVMLKDNPSGFVITHELGHTLGLGHTNLVRCANGSQDGDWSKCFAVEYGGAVDVMSNVDVKGDLSTYHQWRMGILKNTDVVQIWNSQTIDLKYTNSPIGTRAIFIRDGKSTYWIEYRKAMDGYTPGLAIYRTDPPPASAVISPNIKDGIEAPSEFVTSDVWLMNLDNFEYSIVSTASGSPTLPLGKTFLDSSGNVSVSAILKDANTVSVTVERKSDLNPPPTPSLSNTLFWNSPEAELITPGYEDGETTISKFQISMDEEIKDISGGNSAYWYPTYLTPLNPNKTIRVKDLPEGEYSLKIRAVDVFGNISDWSQAVKVSIDRGAPVVTSEIKASTLPNIGTKVIWSGAKDIGSGVCSIQVLNTDGFVVARSDRNTNQTFNPELIFKGEVSGKAQVFDCRGNGVEGNFSVNQVNVSASIARSTGKTKLVNGDMTCNGNCSFSMSINGDLEINISKGSANVFVNNAQVGVAKAGTSPVALSLGKANKVIRIQGKDISFKGLTKFSGSWKQTGTVQRKVTTVDASLENQEQMSISKYGFQISDFEQSYQLLPISRGTTLLDATLDICNGDFPSEKSRVLRRQVAATRVGSPYSFMSTETVRYKNNESAASSLTDIDAVVAKCKITGGAVSGQDVITKYEFSPSPTFNYATGVTGRVVLTLIGSGADSRWLLGFFQVKDDLAVNTYLVRADKFTDADIKRWSQVASEISTRLSGYTPVNSVV